MVSIRRPADRRLEKGEGDGVAVSGGRELVKLSQPDSRAADGPKMDKGANRPHRQFGQDVGAEPAFHKSQAKLDKTILKLPDVRMLIESGGPGDNYVSKSVS